MALNPNVVVVAPNELITSTHLNNVRSNLDRLDVDKYNKAGGNLTGQLTLPTPPTGSAAGIALRTDGAIQSTVVGGGAAPNSLPNLVLGRTNAPAQDAGGVFIQFRRTSAETIIGSITIVAGGTNVAYNTTSDPRLKHRDGDAGDAAAIVRQLGHAAYRGRWLGDDGQPTGDEWVLVNSTDVEDVAPFAVTGERDAVTADGAIDPQQVNYPALVPLLLAAVAQLSDRLDALEGGTP